MTTEITNVEDVIDSRDVIARIEELESDREGIEEMLEEGEATQEDIDQWDENEGKELEALRELQSEALRQQRWQEGYAPDWQYGAQLIRDSYFQEYAEELASDIYGNEIAQARWPFGCIDWERAADELKMYYILVEFDDVDYWIR